MPAPSSQDIRRKALELYYSIPVHVGLPRPEDEELKERNLWREAQKSLMRIWAVDIGREIRTGLEKPAIATAEYLQYLEGELDRFEKMIREVKETPRIARPPAYPIISPIELISLREKAQHYLYSAYAGEPMVFMWLSARGYTTDDLEAEISRLERMIEGRRVGAPIIDIPRMDREIAEKRKIVQRLLEFEEVLRGVERGWTGYVERMKELGYPTPEELEVETYRLREQVADPPQEIRVYLHRFCGRCRDVTRHKLIETHAWECERCGRLIKYGVEEG